MGDRVTQLQDCIDKLAEILFTSLGVLQRDAPLLQINKDVPITAWTSEQVLKNKQDSAKLAKDSAKDIVETVKVIEFLIDKLPGIDETEQQQLDRLKELEEENLNCGLEMSAEIESAELLLSEVRNTINELISDQTDLFRTAL
ncbi:Mediator of RNA polymerase II transcription subunit 21 [Lobulomyces angularis]|nr:Mediator of RNA polymerase II transcription subunit 21 [Lobulomyces angularis]